MCVQFAAQSTEKQCGKGQAGLPGAERHKEEWNDPPGSFVLFLPYPAAMEISGMAGRSGTFFDTLRLYMQSQ